MSDQILEPAGSHEPSEHAKTPKKAAASGWIGSALECYDFFIYGVSTGVTASAGGGVRPSGSGR